MRSKISALKEIADLPACRRIDHDAVGPSKTLQARGKVWCLTNRRLLSRFTRAYRFPNNHQAGRDPDTHFEWLHSDRRLSNCSNHRESGANRPLGVSLTSFRPAKINQHAITHVASDKTAEARDCCSYAGLIFA